MPDLCLAQLPDADALLSRDPFALIIGMTLDQQYPMEHAFRGPQKIAERLGVDHLDPAFIASVDPDRFIELCTTPPAIHRYGRSMAARVQQIAAFIVEHHDGDAADIWTGAKSGADLHARLKALPGWGDLKAKIFTALLGKQLGVQPRGWKAAAGDYSEKNSRRSIADVVDPKTLSEVRAFKQATKKAAREAAEA